MYLRIYTNTDTCIWSFKSLIIPQGLLHRPIGFSAWQIVSISHCDGRMWDCLWQQHSAVWQNRPCFQWLPHAFKHQNLSIKADRSVCLFALPEGTGWMHIWTGACSWRKWASVVQRERLISTRGQNLCAILKSAVWLSCLTWQRRSIVSGSSVNSILLLETCCLCVCAHTQ